MRPTALIICLATFAFAAFLQAALPITTIAGNPSSTAPAAPVSIMLLPFHAVAPTGENAWISSAIDEDLAHDLSRNGAIRVIRPATTQPLAPSDEMAAARDANAQRLISGSYQVVDDQLRITADVLDPSQSQPIGELKATGRVRDLFRLEDSLAMQLWHDLPQADDQASATDFQVTPLDDNENIQAAAPQVVYQPETAPAAVYPDDAVAPFDSVYPYADYGYGYPYGFGVPLFIYGGGFRGGGFHGHYGGHVGGFVGVGSHTAPAVVHAAPSAFEAGGSHFAAGAHR